MIIAAKTAEPHPKLPGTIYTAAEEIEKAGGQALPIMLDIRDDEAVKGAMDEAAAKFGGIDIREPVCFSCLLVGRGRLSSLSFRPSLPPSPPIVRAVVNNASAISNTPTLETSSKKYDLMHSINVRGTFMVTQAALPHLLDSKSSPHVLTLSPPINLDPEWIALAGPAYTAAKYDMSLFTMGWSEEFRGKVAFNALWPRTAIATAAIKMLAGNVGMMSSRKPEIMADAAHAILSMPVTYTGNLTIDDEVLRELAGATDAQIKAYANGPVLMPDFYVGPVDDIKRWLKAQNLVSDVASMVFGGSKKK